jgi:hypothetical protein
VASSDRCSRRLVTRRELKTRVGTPNGSGSLVDMAQKLLEGQATQDARIGRLEACQSRLDRRMSRLEGEQASE